MSTQPILSVVMAVHNSAPYLREALASVRWQSLTDWECICVDDGSTDETPSILQDFANQDSRFRIFRQEKSGIVPALTLGDGQARSDIIARMDSDDVMVPSRLEIQYSYLKAHPECVGVGANVQLIDPMGSPIEVSKYAQDHAEIEHRLLNSLGGTLAHPTLMMRRQAAIDAGGHRPEYPWSHDADLLMRLAQIGKLANLSEVLLLYRQHTKNSCTTKKIEIRTELRSLLREQHEIRDMTMPWELDQSLAKPKKQSSMVGKWARRAARNGYHQTAWNLWREQIRQSPVSIETMRISLEMGLRMTMALASGKQGVKLRLPDWREWDCPSLDNKKQAAA